MYISTYKYVQECKKKHNFNFVLKIKRYLTRYHFYQYIQINYPFEQLNSQKIGISNKTNYRIS